MAPGNLTVRGTGWGFLLVGLSFQHCWFVPESGPDEVVVSNRFGKQATHPSSGSYRMAHRCSACYTVVAPGEDALIEQAIQQGAAGDPSSPSE